MQTGDRTAKSVMTITLNDPQIRFLGENAAVVTYLRINQSHRTATTISASEETRVWQRVDGTWRHVHFHRSGAPSTSKL